jgi:hypothetical protein
VGLATLAPASLALAHQARGVERSGEAPGASLWARDPAPRAARQHIEDRQAHLDGRGADGEVAWRALSGPSSVVAWLVIAIVGLAAPSRRRIVASLAVLALAVLAFETGVHSVHHLGDEAGASQCSVASASTHLDGTPEEGPALRVPILAATETLSFQIAPVASAPFRCDSTRGPPPPLSA